MTAKTVPVEMWRMASAVLSGKAKMPAGLVEKGGPDAGHDQRRGDEDRVEDGPARAQGGDEGRPEEQVARQRVDAVEVDPEHDLGGRTLAEVEARLGDQARRRPDDLQRRDDHDRPLGEGPRGTRDRCRLHPEEGYCGREFSALRS